jgi:hypothetical protein
MAQKLGLGVSLSPPGHDHECPECKKPYWCYFPHCKGDSPKPLICSECAHIKVQELRAKGVFGW